MPRETLTQVKANRNAARKALSAHGLAIHDLVMHPESITWIVESCGAIKLSWGLTRLAGASGGIVITKPEDNGLATIEYLDDQLARIRQLESARASSWQIVMRQLASRAISLREAAIEAEMESRT